MKTVTKQCACGVAFETSLKEVNRGNGKFCSRSCALAEGRSNRKDIKVDVNCGWCKKSFKVKPSRLKTKKGLVYCSRSCKETGQSLDGIAGMQPSHYKDHSKYRQYALDNLKNECNRCGYNKNIKILQAHHKDSNRANNDLENLELLCPNCHAEEHLGA